MVEDSIEEDCRWKVFIYLNGGNKEYVHWSDIGTQFKNTIMQTFAKHKDLVTDWVVVPYRSVAYVAVHKKENNDY